MTSDFRNTKFVAGRFRSGQKQSRHEAQEFGPGKPRFIFCPYGEAVYFKKSWHHLEKFFKNPPVFFKEKPGRANPPNFKKEKRVSFKLCPAHRMLKNKQFEGEVLIKNLPEKFKKEILNLIENMDERAQRRDVLDRVLEIKNKENEIRVTTSENQLAQRIAGKISEVFKKQASVKIYRAKDGDAVKIQVGFRAH